MAVGFYYTKTKRHPSNEFYDHFGEIRDSVIFPDKMKIENWRAF